MPNRFIDAAIVYRILKMLVTPFDKTDAFRLGIIDAKGKILKKAVQLKTTEERQSATPLSLVLSGPEAPRLATRLGMVLLAAEELANNESSSDLEKRLAEAGIKGGKTSADDELARILGK